MSDEIRWEEPPATTRGPSGHKAFADALRAHPGEWAVLGDDMSVQAVSHINYGRYASFAPAGAFEATSRNAQGNKRGTIYVRYVGEVDT